MKWEDLSPAILLDSYHRMRGKLSMCQLQKVVEPIFQITEKMKEESQKGEKSIRGYSLDDNSRKVVLFTDEQLDDIANFCCNDIDGHNSCRIRHYVESMQMLCHRVCKTYINVSHICFYQILCCFYARTIFFVLVRLCFH